MIEPFKPLCQPSAMNPGVSEIEGFTDSAIAVGEGLKLSGLVLSIIIADDGN